MSEAQIHGLMVKVMKSITEVGKGKTANFGERFNYRCIDDAMNNIGDACRLHGVVTSWRTENEATDTVTLSGKNGERTVLRTVLRGVLSFSAPDGSKIESSGYGVGIDSADKSGNKAMAAAFKYAAFMGLCVPVAAGTLEEPDSHDALADSPPSKPDPKRTAAGWKSEAELREMSIEDLREYGLLAKDKLGSKSATYQLICKVGLEKNKLTDEEKAAIAAQEAKEAE
jgi:hypothetical protein